MSDQLTQINFHKEASMCLPVVVSINIYKSPEKDFDIYLSYDFVEFSGFNSKKSVDNILRKIINNFVDNFPMKIDFSYIHLATMSIYINSNLELQTFLKIHLNISTDKVMKYYNTFTEFVTNLSTFYLTAPRAQAHLVC